MRPAGLPPAFVVAALASVAAVPQTPAAQYYLAVDVPTVLGGVTYTPNQILRAVAGAYVVEATFPDGVALAALARTSEGFWLLAPAFPIVGDDPEDLTIETRDVILYDPVNDVPSVAIDGSAAGIPDYAAIDAVIHDPATGAIAVSFDVPVLLGGVEYGPSDIVAYGAGFSLLWSAAAAGVPPSANVVGAEVDSAYRLVLTFDVPVTLGGTTFLPGQLVRWEPGIGFSLYASDPSWPPPSVLAGFGFLPPAGEVPDGSAGSVPLTIAPAAGGDLTLSWGASCAATDTDYAVYEGTLGAPFASHVPVTCSTGGATTWTFTPSAGDHYYLVVPRNGVSEGSYGHGSSLVPRPPSTAACLPQEVAPNCL